MTPPPAMTARAPGDRPTFYSTTAPVSPLVTDRGALDARRYMSLQVPPGNAEPTGDKLVSPLVSARSRTPQRQSDLMEPWMVRSQTPPARPGDAPLVYLRQPAYFPARESAPPNSVQIVSPTPAAPVPVLTSPPAIVQRYVATSPTRLGVTSPLRFVGEWQRRVQPTNFWFQPPFVARQTAPPPGQMPGPGPISEPVGSRFDPTTGPAPPSQQDALLGSNTGDRRSSFREGC